MCLGKSRESSARPTHEVRAREVAYHERVVDRALPFVFFSWVCEPTSFFPRASECRRDVPLGVVTVAAIAVPRALLALKTNKETESQNPQSVHFGA